MNTYFKNSFRLLGFILRKEKVSSLVWIGILVFVSLVIPLSLSNVFDSPEQLQTMAVTMQNPAMIAMMGPVYGIENYTVGAMYANEMLIFMIISVAVMNIFLIVRHTRADEEKGRIEVVRSLPVGRLSNLNAIMCFAVAVNFITAVLCGFAMGVTGIESMDFAGSMTFGAALFASGMFFAAIAALFVQLSSSARGAVSLSFVTLGVLYMVRAVGDISNEMLSLISPLGLILRIQAFVQNNWYPVIIVFVLSVLVSVLAYYLNSLRDIDQGFIAAKPGRREATVMLRSSFGLSFRLLRNTLIAWTLGMYVFGASYGAVMGDIESFIGENDFFRTMLDVVPGIPVSVSFIIFINIMIALVCVVPVLSAILKLRNEEKDSRAEHILARVVSRVNYLEGYLVIALFTSIIIPFSASFGLWSSSAMVVTEPISFLIFFKAMMVYVPAIWVMLGITVLLIGAFPKRCGLCWAYFGFSFFAVYLSPIMDLPEWVKKLTPFGYIPQYPIEEIEIFPLAALTCIAIILIAAGFVFYSKRETRDRN